MPKNSKKTRLTQALSLSQRRIESKTEKNSVKKIIVQKHAGKLQASQFRWINEKLYTSDSKTAQTLMSNEWFEIYHNGFDSQAEKWPLNPNDVIIRKLQAQKNITVADMGCGSGNLAHSLSLSNPDIRVHSFDLVAKHSFITACDIRSVPLASDTVDVCVFCLSLMGTNFIEFIQEAFRILKNGGKLEISEVESRISSLETFINTICQLGFVCLKKNTKEKMFVFLTFEKNNDIRIESIPSSTNLLKPCIYKRR